MATVAELSRQIADVQGELRDLRNESIANVGLLAVAIRRARSQLAEQEQAQAVRRLGPRDFLVGWDPRQGEFGKSNFAQSLAERLAGAGATGAGEPAALQSEIELRDVLDSLAAVFLSSIGNERLEFGSGTATRDLRIERAAVKALQLDDTAGGPIKVWLAGDLVDILNADFAVSYNGDGTVASVTRSGAAGAATTTVTYSGGKVNSVVTVRGGKTVTVIPTYTGDDITSLARSVA